MTPYYDQDGVTIYNGDCLHVLKKRASRCLSHRCNPCAASRSLKKLEDVAMEVGIAHGELFRKTKEGREVRIFSGPMLAKLHPYIKA